MFTHVVHKHTDPRSHQSSAANKDERSRRGVEEEGELLNTASSFLQSVLTGAASAASAAGKLIGGTRGRDFMPPSERNSYLSGRDEMLRDYQGGEFSRSSSGSAGIINRSTGSDVQGPGYHRDREEDNGAAPNNGARKITETLGNTARFAIRVPSDVLVDAVSLTYDVTVSSEDEEGPRRCEDLSPSQAFEVGMAVGEKVRRIFDMYEKRWRHSLRDFHLENPTGSSSVPENRRLPPLVFVRCKSVKLRISGDARPSSPLQVWWSSIASRATGRQSSTRGSVTVRFEKVPVQTSLGPKAYQELGTPIAPYTTSLSAIGQAYALGLADANDIEVVMKRTHQALRSQGPLAQPARVPALVDHQYDLDALMFLLFPKASKQMPPFSITTPMNAMAEAFEQRSVAQMAFLKRAAYSRSYPERALACVAGLERSAEAYYSQLTTPREGIETSTNSERPPFSHSDLRSFALAFAPFICDLDVELATVRFAAEAELQGLAVYFARAIREALAAAEEQGLRLGVVTGLINDKENGTQSLGTSAGSVSNLTPTACALDPYSAKQFRSMYQVLCSRVSPTLCQLFNARLLKNGLLEDMLLMAKERGQGNIDPIRLPRTGIVIFGDGTAPEIFEEKHQQPTKDLLGSMGERLDKVLKEQAGGSFYFPKWPVVESPSRWRNIAHTLELAIGCRLLVAS
ncbi:hypothetical protein CSUI_008004 [Cystoisospora suis]|uniref:Uncharacterized protein n=1 Tax=Cystoisospora suis TaxID=483139 RepID=A0A2C6KNT0_9APIC|nr:hypothetical protein CSUI_008004 [Cystoisospora suis]